jgi:hypothetical protein
MILFFNVLPNITILLFPFFNFPLVWWLDNYRLNFIVKIKLT